MAGLAMKFFSFVELTPHREKDIDDSQPYLNDNGYVVDQDGNKIGECTLLENIPDEEVDEEITPEQMKEEEEREVAKKISNIIGQTLEKMEPICKQITEVSNCPRPSLSSRETLIY